MPRTYLELIDAINRNDLAAVQTILADRDSEGVPFADINGISEGTGRYSVLDYALRADYYHRPPQKVDIKIIKALLDVRDNNNNPVINLNRPSEASFETRSSLQMMMDSHTYNIQEKREMIDYMLTLIRADGSLAFDSQARSRNGHSPLFNAIETQDIEIVRNY